MTSVTPDAALAARRVKATLIGGIAVLLWALLALFMVPRPPMGVAVLQMGITIFTYPVVVALSHMLFGLRKAAPGEVDALGHRL